MFGHVLGLISALMELSQMCKLPMPWAQSHCIPSQMLAFGLCTDRNLDSPLLRWPGGYKSINSKILFKCGALDTFPHSPFYSNFKKYTVSVKGGFMLGIQKC